MRTRAFACLKNIGNIVPVLSLLTLICLGLSVPSPSVAAQGTTPQKSRFSIAPVGLQKTETETVVAVIDGMTLMLKSRAIVRLSGLEIPDMDQVEPGPISEGAKMFLEQMFLNQKVSLYQSMNRSQGRTNRLGQQLAHVVRDADGMWAQGLLLGSGLARARITPMTAEMAPQMYQFEDMARQEKKGLWGSGLYEVLPDTQAEKLIGHYALVDGTIRAAAMMNNKIYLNFGSDWRQDFTVGITPEIRRAFAADNLNPLDWVGRTVRVRGWVEKYNGPYIELIHPASIEFLAPQPPR